jgi:predicted MFS family arabinose efflux permease
VTGAALLAFIGRLILARFADRLDVRVIACAVLIQAGIATSIAALFPEAPWAIVTAVLMYGMTAGNTTTLPPIIVRREFGAVSFGIVFGVCATLMQIMSAMGPAFFGLMRDASGSYQLPLALATAMNFFAALVVMSARQKKI